MTSSVADLLAGAGRRRGRRAAGWPSRMRRRAGAALTWAELDDEVGRVAAGFGAAGPGRRAPGDDRAGQPDRVRHHLPRCAARPAGRRTREPASTRRRAGPDDRRLRRPAAWSPTPTRIAAVREAVDLVAATATASSTGARRGPGPASRSLPRVVVVGAPPATASCSYDRPAPPSRRDRCRRCRTPRRWPSCSTPAAPPAARAAAMLSHRALLANIEQVAAVEPPMITADDVVLGVLPLFHVYGLNAVLGRVLRQRRPAGARRRFDPEGTLDLIEDEAVSVVPVAPPVFAALAAGRRPARAAGPVRLVLSGSAPLAPDAGRRVRRAHRHRRPPGLRPHRGRAGGHLARCAAQRRRRPARSGAALPGHRAPAGRRAGRRARGRGPRRDPDPRATTCSPATGPTATDGPDADGWWATGDVGFLDRDGDLFLVDRLKELVIVSGFNVYPIEVEDVIAEVDGVARGRGDRGRRTSATGEAVVAYVVARRRPDRRSRPRSRAHCEERLARFKQPEPGPGRRRAAAAPSPARSRRAGCAAERRRALGLLE